ncbi:MAG TPA: hypothetical protein VF765_12360 [Polyangiaceae bacterium]
MWKKPQLRTEAARRYAERLQLEQEAPRLRDRVPALATLRLEITDGRNITSADPKHTRIIVVGTAPALFSLMCGDHSCLGGGHDVTIALLDGLRAGATRFEVRDACYGNVGSAECGRTMLVEVTATYR